MTLYLDLTTSLATRIAEGELPPGTSLPSLRDLATAEQTTPTTVRRAYQELAEARAILVEPRRTAKVAPDGASAARAILRGRRQFRLAGSDDPALSMLAAGAAWSVIPAGGSGSYRGLSALWSRQADGAALHLRHRSGEYNAPFARGLLWERRPILVHLWQREQGLLLPPGNPNGIGAISDLPSWRVARRLPGTGTRALLDRLLIECGASPDSVNGPELQMHLDVAIAVATGEADAGLGLRAAATALQLDFVPIGSEPFEIATSEDDLGGLDPLLAALRDDATRAQIQALGGYDLSGAGERVTLT